MIRGSLAGGKRSVALGVFALAMLLLAMAAPSAVARNAYVANSGSDDVSVIDTETNKPVGDAIKVGDGPGGLAITPDGTRIYVANFNSDDVSVIDTASGKTVGDAIKVGDGPRGVAISSDGKHAYVSNELSGTVFVIDTASNETVGDPIAVGPHPLGVAITPDGSRAYVAIEEFGTVVAIDTATKEVVGDAITVGTAPLAIAITPDGAHAYVTNRSSGDVSAIDVITGTVVGTIPIGSSIIGIAITPNGKRGYVAKWGPDKGLLAFNTESNTVIGEPVPVEFGPFGVAITPNGTRAFVANSGSESLSVVSTETNEPMGEPIPVGSNPYGIAITPNQPPLASLASTTGTAGEPIRLDASASKDPDGQVARYDWDFGDGQTALNAGPTPAHTYSSPGAYKVTVTLTDSEGCSTSFVFTGLTASCNGSSVATATRTVQVAPPPCSNLFTIRKVRLNKRRGTATLRIRVTGPGTLLLRGGGVRPGKRTPGSAKTLSIVVRPKPKRMRALERRERLHFRVRTTFRPNCGDARRLTKSLTLIRKDGPVSPRR